MTDDDLQALFNQPVRLDDGPAFEERVMSRLKTKTWLRQGLIALAGMMGGLYALVQFVRFPGAKTTAEALVTPPPVHTTGAFEVELGAGREMFDGLMRGMAQGLDASTDYLLLMQSPAFFWVSFSLCMAIVGLYLANMREEGL
ncbi:MAG: hypothetical protein QM667_09230 [Asticcacaulis sp.]